MHSLVFLLLNQSLTNGILEALSFTVTGTLRAAKNSSPPYSHANTSYYPADFNKRDLETKISIHDLEPS